MYMEFDFLLARKVKVGRSLRRLKLTVSILVLLEGI